MPRNNAPVLTDRHGFRLYRGNIVQKIEDDSRFVISKVVTRGTSPVVYLLKDGNGGTVDACLVMLTDEEKNKNSWEVTSFLEYISTYYYCPFHRECDKTSIRAWIE